MRLIYELVDWIKQIALPKMDGLHPICRRPESNTKLSKGEFVFYFCLSPRWYIGLLLPSNFYSD